MNRILSVFTNCFGADGVKAAVENVCATGFDFLELALKGHNFGGLIIPETAVITVDTASEDVRSFVKLLNARGVKVSGCNVGGADIRTLNGRSLTERRMRFAKEWFGIEIVVSGAGQPVDSVERVAVLKNLSYLGDVANSLGITIALETHKGPTQNASAMLLLMEELDHPNIRLNFDTGNIAYYNDGVNPVDELQRVAHLVRNVHLKDNRGCFEDWYFPAAGDGGAVDFVRIREILDGVGFNGPYTLEIEGIGGEPEPGLNGRLERIRRSAKHLRACGFA